MKVLILAAGYGIRLLPLTLNKPKALLEVGDKVILTRLYEKLSSIEHCDGIYIVTNTKFFDALKRWRREIKSTATINVFNDGTTSNDNRLGAIGDINLAFEKMSITEDVLIIAGDNLFEFNINDFCLFAQSKSPHTSVALFDVKDRDLATHYGIVAIEGDGRISEFQEKPQEPKSTLASTGIYFIPKERIYMVGEYTKIGFNQDAPGNLIKWIATQEAVYGYVFKEGWFDIGSLEALKKADEYYKKC